VSPTAISVQPFESLKALSKVDGLSAVSKNDEHPVVS
jgi:hypothetical protein